VVVEQAQKRTVVLVGLVVVPEVMVLKLEVLELQVKEIMVDQLHLHRRDTVVEVVQVV
jgi:hypothetical protein